ncbi:MAG: tripartite tricarboxylate transporter TctB family protein, partial [Burkholderiales bacterium]
MSLKIKNLPDFMSGLIFTSLGLVVMWAAGEYRLGSAASMGPGYFPRMLGAVLALLGLIVLAQSFGRAQTA